MPSLYSTYLTRSKALPIVLALVFGGVASITLAGCQSTMPLPSVKPAPVTLEQQVAHTLIVLYQPTVNQAELQQIIQTYHGVITHQYPSLNGFAVRFPVGTPMASVSKAFSHVAGVTSVETDSIQTIQPVRDIK